MAKESTTFGLSMLLLLVGLAIMLYGVTLNNGQSLNATMLAGGTVAIVGVGVLTGGVLTLDSGHAAE